MCCKRFHMLLSGMPQPSLFARAYLVTFNELCAVAA
jgi:hypothetical protein